MDNITKTTEAMVEYHKTMENGMEEFFPKVNRNIFLISKLWYDSMENHNSYGYEPVGYTNDEEYAKFLSKIMVDKSKHYAFTEDMPMYRYEKKPNMILDISRDELKESELSALDVLKYALKELNALTLQDYMLDTLFESGDLLLTPKDYPINPKEDYVDDIYHTISETYSKLPASEAYKYLHNFNKCLVVDLSSTVKELPDYDKYDKD